MHKRILCVVLAVLILLSLIPALALPSQATSNMIISEECVQILKKMEGFVQYPMWDYNHYSVGYGSTCEKNDYPNGITLEEADMLMREFLMEMEDELNRFANRHEILFSQNQFDALMLFTYNCGTGWLYGNGEFRQAVLDDLSGNNFIFYMSQWSAAGGDLLPSLITRRLIESDMYLNGSYTNEKPENYSFVYFDYNGGDGNVRVQGYDWDLPAYVKPAPTRDEYRFMGWYTEAEEGTWVTELSAENAEQTLYAHWQGPDVFVRKPVAVSYQIPSELLASRELFDVPNGTPEGKLTEGAVAEIRGEYVDENGVKWGKLSNNSWVNLGDPRIGTGDETEHKTGVKVVVTGDYLNVRVAPGAQYKAIAGVLEGDEIVITETVDVAGVLWGKFRAGWVCLQYTDYAGGLKPGQPEDVIPEGGDAGNVVIATGTVTVGELYIRAVAGTHGYLIGAYRRGDKVEILEKTMVNGATWGRTNMGWISLAYVDLDASVQTPESTIPTETTAPETTVPETTVPETTVPETTVPETTAPEKEEQKPDTDDSQGIPATVISRNVLNIRSGAGTNYARCGYYSPGQKIRILEQKTVGGALWGRTGKGWVSMQYVQLDEQWSNESGVYGTVISTGGLNIRTGPGVAHYPVDSYASGTRIVILEQTIASGQKWGRTDKGWVSMDYVRLEAAVSEPGGTENPEDTEPGSTSPETEKPQEKPDTAIATGTVTAFYLNVRDAAGIKSKIIGDYCQGDQVDILEKTVVNGAVWGRTGKGWISLAYVELDVPQSQKPGNVGVITANILCIRKGPGTGNAVLDTYVRGQEVTILETAKVGTTTWGRTDKGWICMDYVK